MVYIITVLITLLFTTLIYILDSKTTASFAKTSRILSVLLFLTFLVNLFARYQIDNTFNLLLTDIDTPIDPYQTWLFGASMSIFMIILRWFTTVIFVFIIIQPFIKLKTPTLISGYFGLVIAVLNLIFLKQNIIMMLGEAQLTHYRSLFFILQISLMATMSIHIILKNKFDFKISHLATFFIASLGLIPLAFFYNIFGNYGQIPEEYNRTHLFLFIVPAIFMIVSYIIMRKKTQTQKDYFITFVAFAAFIQYFSYNHHGLGGLPLHLCNTAVIIMLFSVIFRWRGFFYFNYFANVVGALMAFVFPDISSDLFSMGAMRYAYNHWYVIAWPILAVALHTFKRPTLKDMYKAIGVFTVYYILIVFINAWFNNYQSVDYFFTYSNHITSIVGLTGLQYNHVISFTYHNLELTFFWLYQILFYVSFIFIMFMSWYVYDAGYKFADRQHQLHLKQQQIMMDQLQLKTLLNGRSTTEPIHPEGVNMIKISHLSKKYGHSETYAVKDFSLEVKMGEVFGFLGHNGAGKSTTIKSLVGIQSITEGEIEICGYSIKSQPLQAKLNIGYVSDNHAVYEKLTGREYIQYIADLYQVPFDLRDQRLEKLLDQFSLRHAIDKEIKSYSHGMKQKLVVIAALIHEPPVWILDEPLTGLDPTSAYQIKKSMKEHAKNGNIVFFSSHVIEVVEHICDRIAIITHGELQGVYDMKEIKEKNISLEELYMSKINNESESTQ